MEKQNEVWTVKGKYPSRFYSPGGNCVSSLLPVWPLIPHLWVQAGGTTHRAEDSFYFFFNLLLSQLKAVWDRNHVYFGFLVADNSVSFQNECWSPGIPEHAKSLREPWGSAEPESLASMRTWLKTLILGGTLVRGIGLCAPSAGGLSLILGQGTRSHKPKFRPGTAKTKNKTEQLSKQLCI